MFKINENYLKLPGSYLFSMIGKKVSAYKEANPDRDVISLGIGDVTLPLVPEVIKKLHGAVDEMAVKETFRGYTPDLGYQFLRDAIIENDFLPRGVQLDNDEVFISDGAKSDTGNIGDIFSVDNRIAVTDPVYPVYVDSNVMNGRGGIYLPDQGRFSDVIYMPCTAENNFVPELPKERPDIIYLCFPNNPTGTTITKDQLQVWVDYARREGSVIIFDAAYEAYITEDDVPHSIYECEGAKECAIEIRSYSKNAGFTGTRLGFTVVPKQLMCGDVHVRDLWARRHGTKFNGAPYIVQMGAMGTYTPEGKKQIREEIDYYMENARTIRQGLADAGYAVYGGVNSPYIWMKTPKDLSSWEFFDLLLNKANVVGTPGSGFGPHGEGYFRLTSFGTHENTKKAIERIIKL